MVVTVAVGIRTHMQVIEIDLLILHQGIAVLEVSVTVPQGLHLRAHQDDPRLASVVNKVI